MARGGQRREDPTTSCHDLHVAFTLQAHLELARAVACPDQVGMRIHKARHNCPPTQINTVRLGMALDHFGFCSNSEDRFAFAHDRTLLYDAEFTEGQTPLGTPLKGDQL